MISLYGSFFKYLVFHSWLYSPAFNFSLSGPPLKSALLKGQLLYTDRLISMCNQMVTSEIRE